MSSRGAGALPLVGVVAVVVALALGPTASLAAAQAPGAFGRCVPRAERAGRDDVGCFIITEQALGPVGPDSVYWHVTRVARRARARAAAARAAASGHGPRSTVVEAYGDVWLLTIAGPRWRAASGTHVTAIGPLPVAPGVSYSALYMEASMQPGMKSAVHRHSGPEAWYTLSGETCLETPNATQVGRAHGPPVIVPGGLPMELTATGSTLRRSLVLILHDASQPPTTMESSWKPRGLCTR